MKRPKISQKVIDQFSKMIDIQDEKGIAKYGRSIDDAIDQDYDWRIMALEECADQLKYMAREIKMLDKQLKEERRQRLILQKTHLRNINFDEQPEDGAADASS